MSSPSLPRHTRTASHASHASLASVRSIAPRHLSALVIPLIVLLAIVVASAAQTEVAHHLTTKIGYHQPYFTFYLTHITFALVFPLHLGLLLIFRPAPLRYYLDALRWIVADQLGDATATWRQVAPQWSAKVTWLTVLVSVPALSWFIAVNLTTGLAVTTIYATSSFWTYLFSMILLKQPLSRVTVGSIALAFLGVLVLALDGIKGEASEGAPYPMLGDLVMTFGAVILGLYEVVYKMALPEGHGGVKTESRELDGYTSLPNMAVTEPTPTDLTPPDSRADTPPLINDPYPPTGTAARSRAALPLDRKTSRTPLLRLKTPPSPPSSFRPSSSEVTSPTEIAPPLRDTPEPPTLPAALHANFLTSCIGLATLVLLWAPIPLLHLVGWETFRWPGSLGGDAVEIWAELQVVAWGGAVYNAGLMVLIGIWGPTTSSVANLLTIGLVALLDAVWIGEVPSAQSLVGVGMICVGFGVLLWEGEE